MSSLTTLGLIHTGISVLAIPVGLYAFLRDGKIEPRNWVGKLYVDLMLFASFSAFGISKSGHFGPGHFLALLTLALFFTAFLTDNVKWFRRSSLYVETFSYSASFFMLMFFATTETLTRFPAAHPFASNAEDPVLMPVRIALLVAFVAGFGYQLFELWSMQRQQAGLVSQPILARSRRVSTLPRK